MPAQRREQEPKKIKITLKRSLIGVAEPQKRVVEALGLRRVNHTVEKMARPDIMGMISRVKHLLNVVE